MQFSLLSDGRQTAASYLALGRAEHPGDGQAAYMFSLRLVATRLAESASKERWAEARAYGQAYLLLEAAMNRLTTVMLRRYAQQAEDALEFFREKRGA